MPSARSSTNKQSGTQGGTAGLSSLKVPSANSPATTDVSLGECVEIALTRYFDDLSGFPADGLYNLVIAEVERPLLLGTLAQVNGNQTQAARLLGMSRGTLRNKLAKYGIE